MIKFIKRELLIYYRDLGNSILPVLFLLLMISVFAISLSLRSELFDYLGGSIVWATLQLAILLSLNTVLEQDYNNGVFEQILLGKNVYKTIFAKILAHCIMVLLPMLILMPVLAVILNLSGNIIYGLGVSLVLGAPSLIVLGFLGQALIVGLKHGGMLLGLLVLPLYFPVLIIGASAISQVALGYEIWGHIALLLAALILVLLLAPIAVAAALRISVTS